jgi:hypothetical protein
MNRPRYLYPAVGGLILIVILIAAYALNGQATAIAEGPKFREMLEKETAKGMHFQSAHYEPITRV